MTFPVRRVVLFKHGIGHFEREGAVAGDANWTLTFKQSEVSEVLKSLTVLDLDGGHVASVSYDSTRPLDQLLQEVDLHIPDQGSLVGLLPQIKGARVRIHTGVSDPIEGIILGIDATERSLGEGVVKVTLLSVLTELTEVRSFDLHQLAGLQILDAALRRDLDYYLKTQLSAKKKDSRTFTFFAQGQGTRRLRVSYTLEAPVWKATYRILLGEEDRGPTIQGWAVVDNTQDEDWEEVTLSLVSGLPVSFRHDLYTPRYIHRPEVAVRETTGVLPPEMEQAMDFDSNGMATFAKAAMVPTAGAAPETHRARKMMAQSAVHADKADRLSAISSAQAQVRERKIGDLFEYEIEHPVTIRRNQSALVPIVLRGFEGRTVLLYNKTNRADNPIRCVEFKNTTGLTLEGGPITVIEAGSYVGEAMLETIKPSEERLIPYAVELSVHVLDNIESHHDRVHRVVIQNGVLSTHAYQVIQTTYHINNKAAHEYVLWLEHPRQGGWELFETLPPVEVTENYWRFRLEVPASQTVRFVVRQKIVTSNAYGLADLRSEQLEAWLSQKYLDAKTEGILKQALHLQREASGYQAAAAQLEKDRATIHQEQVRIRENLQALGDRPSEKDLRERFVRTLNGQEDRLEQIDREIRDHQQRREECRTRLKGVLEGLAYDVKV